MLFSIDVQAKILFFNLLAGALTGVLYDIFKIIKGKNNNKFVGFIQDILFWILCAILIFIFLFSTGYLYVGMYCYLYIALGFFIYFKLASKYFTRFIISLLKGLGRFFRLFINFLTYVFKIVIYNIKKR